MPQTKVRLNRDKLIEVIKKDFESCEFNAKTIPESISDAIILALPELLESCEPQGDDKC